MLRPASNTVGSHVRMSPNHVFEDMPSLSVIMIIADQTYVPYKVDVPRLGLETTPPSTTKSKECLLLRW